MYLQKNYSSSLPPLPTMQNRTTPTTFFTQLYYPDMTTTAIIMADLAEDLASYGLNVGVTCAQATYLVNEKSPKSEFHNEVGIKRVWTFLFNKNKNIGRILNSTSCFLSMLPSLFFENRKHLLVINTNPALLTLLGVVANKLKKQKYVVLIHDLWPELPAQVGMISRNGFIYRLIDFVNILALKNASGIVVLSETMKNAILKKVPEKRGKVHVLPNWADQNRIYPVPKDHNAMLKGIGLKDKKVVMYSGNIGRYQPMEVMIQAAGELRHREDVAFVFAGDGGKKKEIERMAVSMNLDNVTFLPFQPLGHLAESLSMADLSLVGIYPENEGVIMPSKLYGLLAVGKPIICVSDPESEVVGILRAADAGVHSSIDDPKELARKIEGVLDNEARAVEMGENGRRYFLEHFERKKITRQWKDLLTSL